MLKKYIMYLVVIVLSFSINTFNSENVQATTMVMWGKTELKVGQVGKVTILGNTNLYQLDNETKLTSVRVLKKGEEFRVYSVKNIASDNNSIYYAVGGGNYIKAEESILYETPSKSKLALLAQLAANPSPVNPPVAKPTAPKVEDGLEIVKGAPTSFSNCTALNKHYPNGVKKGHPAYATKHDRDKDNWACEQR